MEVKTKVKPTNVVIVQMRQRIRGKDGTMHDQLIAGKRTRNITIYNATMDQVEAALTRGIGAKG